MLSSLIVVSAAAQQLKADCCFNATEIFRQASKASCSGKKKKKTFRGLLHDIRMNFVRERVHTGCYIITSVKLIRNKSFLSEFIGVFITERNTHSGRPFIPVQRTNSDVIFGEEKQVLSAFSC